MNPFALFACGFLVVALAPPAVAQGNEAEKLFRDMEKRIKAAKAVQVVFDIKMMKGNDKLSGANGFLLLTKDNKARLKISGQHVGKEMVSNGKQMRWVVPGSEASSIDRAKAMPVPKHFHAWLSTLVSRAGVTSGSMALPYLIEAGEEISPDRSKLAVWDFKAGAAEKVGTRDAKVVSYRLGEKGDRDSAAIRVWIDANTLLPLKQVIALKHDNLQITEIYSEFKLDPKIDATSFEMISVPVNEAEKLFRTVEEKIRTAKAVQVAFDVKWTEEDKKGTFKGSLLFTKDNKARLKMSGKPSGKDATVEMISDGKQMKLAESPDPIAKAEIEKTPAKLHGALIAIVNGPSLLFIRILLCTPDAEILRAVYFRSSAAEKVRGRDAKVVTYNVVHLFGASQVTLWIDTETLLPVKRLILGKIGSQVFRITEICSFNLNPKVEVGAFELPK